jgi:IS30 family transposase
MNKQKTNNKQFSYEERVKIETFLEEKHGVNYIARKLHRSKGSVSEEIKRNSVKGIYTAKKAQLKAYQRRWRAKYQVLKIAINSKLQDYVEDKIHRYWSPEGISGRIKFVETNFDYVGKDAIYSYVKSVHGRNLEKFLWYKGKKWKSKHYSKVTQLKDRMFIDQRPKYIEKRRFFGDWEADFIVSGRKGKGALLVFVERKSRYVLIFKLEDRKVATINYILHTLTGANLVANSLTIDNDICFRHHKEMSEIMKASIYFCHPYHSWEKGAVEKMNQLIRRFIPKGANISKVSEKKILWVQNILNGRPYKCLGFYTPAEIAENNMELKIFVNKIKTTPVAALY